MNKCGLEFVNCEFLNHLKDKKFIWMLHLIFTGKNISEFEQGLTFAILSLI